MRRAAVALGTVATLVVGYAGLDVADAVPGLLTTKPVPPPPPTETAGTRTLPVVPQPTPSTSVGMPLSSLAGDASAPSAAGVRAALADVVGLPALRDSAFVVRDGQSGAVLFGQEPGDLRIPASTTKLLSAAAIGQVFTPEETLHTVVRQGSSPTDIVLVAGGDSLLNPGKGDPESVNGRAGLADLADQVATALKAKGIAKVSLAVDDSYALGPAYAPTWDASFPKTGIVGAVAMLGLSTQRAGDGRVGSGDPTSSVQSTFASLLEDEDISVSVDATRATSVETPTGNPTTSVTGTPTPGAAGAGAVLGHVESAPVRDQLALALTESDNTLTEILARQAGYRSGAGTDFADTGGFVLGQVSVLGVDTTGALLLDASGLSRENRVTATLLTDVLVLGYDGKHPVLRTALDGMPIGGLTGTLADRFQTAGTHEAAGRARAKTGTLTGANALAGSVVDDDGRLLVFAGLVADAPTLDARAALDRVVAALAACGCR